jgi:protein-tyrosine-phosphatase
MNAVVPLYRVLFVCAGNTCRSPLASAAFRQTLAEDGRRVEIESAGVRATPGSPATLPAIEVGSARGLDLRPHRAQRLTAALLERADLILALDANELEAAQRMSPTAASRVHLLTDYGRETPSGEGVPDPFGGSREAYEECLLRILENVQRIAPIVLREVKAREEAESASRNRGAA